MMAGRAQRRLPAIGDPPRIATARLPRPYRIDPGAHQMRFMSTLGGFLGRSAGLAVKVTEPAWAICVTSTDNLARSAHLRAYLAPAPPLPGQIFIWFPIVVTAASRQSH